MIDISEKIQSITTSKNPLLVITGPTCSGKTDIAIKIAQKYNGEIINADSRQIYTDIPITSAMPTPEEIGACPHHLFDILPPEKSISVHEWKEMAEEKIKEIYSRNNLPILCGGTGLYINALLKGFQLGVPPDESFREEMNTKTGEELYEILLKKDQPAALSLHPSNKKYLIRALEICEHAQSKSEFISQNILPEYSALTLVIYRPREILYERINQRTEIMFENGFLEECKNLIEKYPHIETELNNDGIIIAHGLREGIQALHGEISREEAKEIMQQKTRHYAKRQMTWWRREKENVTWINAEEELPL